jgi:hypothetical protein
MSDPTEPAGAGPKPEEHGLPEPVGQVRAFGEMVVGGMAGATLLLVVGVLLFFDMLVPGRDEQPTTAVLGTTVTAPTNPPETVTNQDPAAAWAALVAKAPTTTAPPTTTTTAPPTTTTTVPPPPIAEASATITADGVTLDLDVIPSTSGRGRALDARLLARFDDARVLRTVAVDFGDGTTLPGDVNSWACNAHDAPNPYDLSLPGHTYRGPGTYVVRATVITATCSPDDDDWGPEASSQVELSIVVH